jgi:hypothetical protein
MCPQAAPRGDSLGVADRGRPLDETIYDADPRTDLAQLDSPRTVILRGRLIHRP